jgi:hypothetical protein
MRRVSLLSIGLVFIGLVSCTSDGGSPTKVDRSASQLLESPHLKSQKVLGFFDDLIDVLTVVVADAAGALGGSTVGTAVGGPGVGTAVGAVAGAVAASVIAAEADELVSTGSPNPFNSPYSPYAGSKPSTLDSIGWLHNDCVQASVINAGGVSGAAITSYTLSRLINTYGYPSSPTSSIDWNAIDSICLAITNESTIPGMLSHISGLGLTTEADYIQDLVDDIFYLYNNSYGYEAAVDLVETYKDDVDDLSLSTDRKEDLKRSLSVFAYSMALWSMNP